jgi:hypothetical protein
MAAFTCGACQGFVVCARVGQHSTAPIVGQILNGATSSTIRQYNNIVTECHSRQRLVMGHGEESVDECSHSAESVS